MIDEQTINDIQDGLVSVTFDSTARSMTFRYEAGAPIMVNECIAWCENVDTVMFFEGERMTARYKQTAPHIWDDELGSGRACSLAPHSAQPRGAVAVTLPPLHGFHYEPSR